MAENKVIDTVTPSPIPEKSERSKYRVPFVKDDGVLEPQGGNFNLDDLLNVEATQEELDALQKQINDNKTAQDTKNEAQDTEIAKKVDSTVQTEKDASQDAEIALKANKADSKLFLMTADTTAFKLDGNKLPQPNNQKAHVKVDKRFIDGDVTIEGLKEQPVNPLEFDFEPKDMAEEGIVLKNIMTVNTDEPVTEVYPSRIEGKLKSVVGHNYYIRLTTQIVGDYSQATKFIAIYTEPDPLQKKIPVDSEEHTVSVLGNFGNDVTSFSVGSLALPYNESYSIKYQKVMVLDITALSEKYPQYSDKQLKAILDESLPYISAQQSVTLGGVCRLENLVLNPTSTEGWTIGSEITSVEKTVTTLKGTITKTWSNSSGSWFKRELSKRVEVGQKIFSSIPSLSPENDVAIGLAWNMSKGIYSLREVNSWDTFMIVGLWQNPPQEVSFDCSKGVICIDTTSSLLDLWLSLNGYSTDEQKADWCNEHIPPFEGTYDLWVGAIKDEHTLTARCGEHTSSLTFKTVFDKESVATQPYVDNALRDKADVITNTRRGASPLVCTDSDAEPFLGMTIFGKTEQFSTEGNQLLNYPNGKSEIMGITWDIKDGTFHVFGTSSSQSTCTPIILELPIGDYYISQTNILYTKSLIEVSDSEGSKVYYSGQSFSVKGDERLVRFYAYVSSGKTIDAVFSPMLNKGSSPLPFEPYTGGKPSPSPEYPQEIVSAGASGSIETKVGGKNLIEMGSSLEVINGVTFEKKEDGSIHVHGNASATAVLEMASIELRQGIYFLSGCPNVEINTYKLDLFNPRLVVANTDYGDGVIVRNKQTDKWIPRIVVYPKAGIVDTVIKPQLEVGSKATSYEPYIPIQTATASTPNGLTKWDRIEKRDGVWGVVKKYKTVTLDGSPDEVWEDFTERKVMINLSKEIGHPFTLRGEILCSRFTPTIKTSNVIVWGEVAYITVGGWGGYFFGIMNNDANITSMETWKAWLSTHPVEICFPCVPTFTPLPPEQQAQFEALHSNNPTTTVWNEDGTEYELDYRAETKRIVKQMASDIVKNEAIYEMGENYIKYANGTAMCWGEINIGDVSATAPSGSIYAVEKGIHYNFPISFTEKPIINANMIYVNGYSWLMGILATNTHFATAVIGRTNTSSFKAVIHYQAIGRWK